MRIIVASVYYPWSTKLSAFGDISIKMVVVLALFDCLTSCQKTTSCTKDDVRARGLEIESALKEGMFRDTSVGALIRKTSQDIITDALAHDRENPEFCERLDELIGSLKEQAVR